MPPRLYWARESQRELVSGAGSDPVDLGRDLGFCMFQQVSVLPVHGTLWAARAFMLNRGMIFKFSTQEY